MRKIICLIVSALISFTVVEQTILAQTQTVQIGQVIAGRVMSIERTNNLFTVHPYRSSEQKNDVNIVVDKNTLYEWSPRGQEKKAPTLNDVKRGSWVRVHYNGKVVSKVVIHSKTTEKSG